MNQNTPLSLASPLSFLEKITNINASISTNRSGGTCNMSKEPLYQNEALDVLEILDLAQKNKNPEIVDQCLLFFNHAYDCEIHTGNANQLIISLCNLRNSFENLDSLFLNQLIHINEKNTGTPRRKNEITLNVQNEKCIPPEQLLHMVRTYSEQIKSIRLFKYRALNDHFLRTIGTHCLYLKSVDFDVAKSITNKGLSYLSSLPFLKEITLTNCETLTQIFLSNAPALEQLSIKNCQNINGIYLNNCVSLKSLILDACHEITTVCLKKTNRMQDLYAQGCYKLTKLIGIDKLHSLKNISICYCLDLQKLSIENLENLETIYLEALPLTRLSIKNLKLLQTVNIKKCALTSLKLNNVPNLSTLNIENSNLKSINLKNAENLQELMISFCSYIQKILGLNKLRKLKRLEFFKCRRITRLAIKDLPNLNEISIGSCLNLSALKCQNLPNLKKLTLSTCRKLKKMSGLNSTPQLKQLILKGNKNLQELKVKNMHLKKKFNLIIDNSSDIY